MKKDKDLQRRTNEFLRKGKISSESKSEKVSLVTIQIDAKAPIEDFMCRTEHKNLFESIWSNKQ